MLTRLLFMGLLVGVLVTQAAVDNSRIIGDNENNFLFVGTLDGKLHSFDRQTGDFKWSFSGDPIIKTPKLRQNYEHIDAKHPISDELVLSSFRTTNTDKFYLPDPSDGSLFLLQNGKAAQKFPLTVKELVQLSPYVSREDNTIVLGKFQTKVYAVDANTGETKHIYKPDFVVDKKAIPENIIFISQSEYSLSFMDASNGEETWNVTFSEYVAKGMQTQSLNHDINLLRTSLASKANSDWLQHFDAPPIALYAVGSNGRLEKIAVEKGLPTVLVGDAPAIDESSGNSVFVGYVQDALMALQRITPLNERLPLFDFNRFVDSKSGESVSTTSLTPFYLNPGTIFSVPMDQSTQSTSNVSNTDLGHDDHEESPLPPDKSEVLSEPVFGSKPLVWLVLAIGIVVAAASALWLLRRQQLDANPTVENTERKTPTKKKKKGNKPTNETTSNKMIPEPAVHVPSANVSSNADGSLDRTSSKNADGWMVIGSLLVSQEVLGRGSHGTTVYRGMFDGRHVAVKRMLDDYYDLAEREVGLLQQSDDHSNVIRYYCRERADGFLYIALELCAGSIYDFVEHKNTTVTMPSDHRLLTLTNDGLRVEHRDKVKLILDTKLLDDVLRGLAHLHHMSMVHRDVKPQNILITPTGRVLISDFGLSKKLADDQSSFRTTANNGTLGWSAPETLSDALVGLDDVKIELKSSDEPLAVVVRKTKSVDVFSAGCVIYYVLTRGKHPFGTGVERPVNIIKGIRNLSDLNNNLEAQDLVDNMIRLNASERITMQQARSHPFFWDAQKRLSFLQDASDRFEIEDRESSLVTLLETGALHVIGTCWHDRLDTIFLDNLGKYRKYQGASVRDLLRALRNKKHHYQDLPADVQHTLGPLPEGFLTYFTSRFPRLLLHVYAVIVATCSNETMFTHYLTSSPDHH